MKLKKIVIVLGASLVALIAVLGMIAPTDVLVEKAIVINKPKNFVFERLKFVKSHNEWSPWAKKDPNIKNEYKGEDGAVGFVASWSGNSDVGVGEQEIKKIVDGQEIQLELRFKEPMEDTSTVYLITEALSDTQTTVKWGMRGKMKFPGNIFCLIFRMHEKLGRDFEEGLQSLKTILER